MRRLPESPGLRLVFSRSWDSSSVAGAWSCRCDPDRENGPSAGLPEPGRIGQATAPVRKPTDCRLADLGSNEGVDVTWRFFISQAVIVESDGIRGRAYVGRTSDPMLLDQGRSA